MRTLVSGVFIALLFTICQAQTVRPPLTAAAPLLSAYSPKQTDAFSFLANPAALANIIMLTGGVYTERPFLMQELARYQLAACVPTSSGIFGFTGNYIGQNTCYEGGVGLAYGRKLGNKVDVGTRFNYHAIKVAGYGRASTLFAEAGALLHLHQQVHLGLRVSNPTGAALGKEGEEKLPVVVAAGVGYDVSPQFFVAAEVHQIIHQELSVNTAMQYRFNEQVWARVGFRSVPSAYFLGLGFALKTLHLEATASIHPQLGLTPGLMLLFVSKQKEP